MQISSCSVFMVFFLKWLWFSNPCMDRILFVFLCPWTQQLEKKICTKSGVALFMKSNDLLLCADFLPFCISVFIVFSLYHVIFEITKMHCLHKQLEVADDSQYWKRKRFWSIYHARHAMGCISIFLTLYIFFRKKFLYFTCSKS